MTDSVGLRVSVQDLTDARATIVLEGEIDLATAAQVSDAAKECISSGAREVVLDLSEVSFCDSVGLGALIGVHRAAQRAGGTMRLLQPTSPVRKLLQITGLDQYFVVEPPVPGPPAADAV